MPFRPIHCPYCGLELQVPEDASQVTCMYCAKPIDLKALFCPADEAPSSGLQLQQALSLLTPALFRFTEEEANFTARRYADAFAAYCEKLRPALESLSGLAQEECHGFAQALVDGAVADLVGGRTTLARSKHFFTRRLMLAAYLLPALRESKMPEAQTVLETFLRIWNERYPQQPLSSATFKQIQDGFRRRGCYITTAVCTARGEGDDAPALQALRQFRDGWLARQPLGPLLTREYYVFAPAIVKEIDASPDAGQIYRAIWSRVIEPCLEDLRHRRFSACFARYVRMVFALEQAFLTAAA